MLENLKELGNFKQVFISKTRLTIFAINYRTSKYNEHLFAPFFCFMRVFFFRRCIIQELYYLFLFQDTIPSNILRYNRIRIFSTPIRFYIYSKCEFNVKAREIIYITREKTSVNDFLN